MDQGRGCDVKHPFLLRVRLMRRKRPQPQGDERRRRQPEIEGQRLHATLADPRHRTQTTDSRLSPGALALSHLGETNIQPTAAPLR